jgi:integrase
VRTERPRSIANIHRILAVLRHCLAIAVRQGWVSHNPFILGEPLIRPSHERKRDRILSPKEEAALLGVCVGPRAHLRLILLGFLDTAMREGELKTRRRRDLDFDAREIHIFPKPLTSSDWTTKTEEGRTVPMSERLHEELLARGAAELPANALVFGYRWSIKTAWRTARRLAGVAHVQLRDLRHTAITRLIAGGMEIAEAGRIAGHRDIRTTYRYVNPHAGTIEKARSILNGQQQPRDLHHTIN